MFDNVKREYSIYKTLKALSRQRVRGIIQPGNVWTIEKAIPDDEKTEANLRTCHMRGWVEPIADSIPKLKWNAVSSTVENAQSAYGPIYRLTDSGWNAIHRTYIITLLSLIASLLAIGITVLALKY